jgi:hypothetical protein
VWSDGVVMPTPLLNEYLGFFQREEDFTVEQFIA